ncbi:DUF4269 domain-containing protein [Chitinophaga sp. 30R24]|uniref:DUF4269 domain-containing protein n=1 Tax=Chitinophaga sp. 30R24 TaxID=3248838 RepID=UPI003B91BBE6
MHYYVEKFSSIHYLKNGNSRQQSAFNLLQAHHVMDILADFDPLLAGTVPIGIDTASSDLDIICFAPDLKAFSVFLEEHFAAYSGFQLTDTEMKGENTIIAHFTIDGWPLEIFGQNVPAVEQAGFRHMIVEYSLLHQYGEPLKQRIIELKQQGYKTEPAFAVALGLKGDPYQALLDIAF